MPIVTPFSDIKSNVDHLTLCSIGKPFEFFHADIADARFLKKNRSLLAKKLKLFYEDIKPKGTGRMRLQTDLEFK